MMGGTGLLLLSAAAGYWVLERAEVHKRGLRRVGRWVGGLIIVVSILGLLCRASACMSKGCPWTSKSTFCPIKDRLMLPTHPAAGVADDSKPLP